MSAARRRGRYTLGERIGTGGVAEVYLATAEGAQGFEKKVVVKCLKPALAETPEVLEGLRTEAELAQRLSHGNVVQVLDFGQDEDGSPFLVMEYVDGCSLRELCESVDARSETIPLPDGLRIVEKIADALRYVHGLTDDDGVALGLVHRDVTPNNILISRDGVIKLTDFGIAKAGLAGNETLPGVIKGTPRYLSPEQATGRVVDGRTDVYALGLVLGELVGPDADEGLRRIIDRATEPAVRDRHPDIDAFAQELHEWRQDHRIRTTPDELARLVRGTREQAQGRKKAIDLDAALLGGAEEGATRQHDPAAPPTAAKRRTPWAGVAALAALVAAGLWWSQPCSVVPAEPEPQPGTSAQAELDRPATVAPEPDSGPAAPLVDSPVTRIDPPPESGDLPVASADPPPPPEQPAAKRRGRLKINVLPYADVSLDGRNLGRTPIDRPVSAGRHRVELSNPDTGKKTTQRVEVRAGKLTQITDWEGQ